MTVRGNLHTLTVQTVSMPGGDPVDPSDLVLRILRAGVTVAGPLYLTDVTRQALGFYSYSWPIPDDAEPGDHLAEWTATIPGDPDPTKIAYEVFSVAAHATFGDISPSAVQMVTGVQVTEQHIATARALVGLNVGYDLEGDMSRFRKRDLRLITSAIIWQAPYVKAHPDVATGERANVTGASTNGNSISFGVGGMAGELIAPAAAMSLKRLSWRRSRSIPMRIEEVSPLAQTLVSDGADSDWRRL